MIKNILLAGLLVTTIMSHIEAKEEPTNGSDGFYIGTTLGFLNFGGDSLNVTTINTTKKNTETTYKDVTGSPIILKIGYQHFNQNRLEIYVNYNKIDATGGSLDIDTYGVNYEWGFPSFTEGSSLTPYIMLGGGRGKSDSSTLKKLDNTDVVELTTGLGVHYAFNQSIDANIGYSHRTLVFDNQKTLNISDTSLNIIEAGVTYHF